MKIEQAKKEHAHDIALLIMQAMTDECCMNMVGPGKTLADFELVMTDLASSECSQYSYRNTLVALTDDNRVAGAIVAYRGEDLHALRKAFLDAAKERLGRNLDNITDETEAGEYYIDSVAVYPDFRRMGVASSLLRAAIERAHSNGLPAGLLVDKQNPNAERLYTALGFRYIDDKMWSGHEMKHMRCYCPE